ncbi:hypothetical protein [Streptomyces aureus]|uniref:hypothetical protein n=1 Tax=Streptomyces aureus TaxID=193461 RepID=UPI00131AE8D9|nr:hypothetical protein [Streptomyces aureus]
MELLAGAVVGYMVRKLRRVAGRADQEVDQVLDTGMDAIHELVTRNLSGDPALETLVTEVDGGDGEVSDRTLRRVSDAVAQHAEDDTEFADELQTLVDALDRHLSGPDEPGGVHQKADASGGSKIIQAGRDVTIHERAQ